jgi:hypothetical protein
MLNLGRPGEVSVDLSGLGPSFTTERLRSLAAFLPSVGDKFSQAE